MKTWTVGAVLRRLQKEADLDQRAIARRFGVTQSAISKWMTGERRPRAQAHRRKLLDLGVDPRFL